MNSSTFSIIDGIDFASKGRIQYRYGFNGMEGDNEVKGTGNSYDFGARMYDPRLGRWLSRDPLASEFPHQSVYTYVSNSPTAKIDIDGEWDVEVHAYKDRKRYGYASLIVKDRHGKEVYRTIVRVHGKTSSIGQSRTEKGGDTPTGTYKILEWRKTGNDRYPKTSYGPNDLLALDYQNGEAKAKGRQGMHLHGGRQQGDSKMKYGLLLWNTQGCMRIKDEELKEIQNITQKLEKSDPLEQKGYLTVKNDLVFKDEEFNLPPEIGGLVGAPPLPSYNPKPGNTNNQISSWTPEDEKSLNNAEAKVQLYNSIVNQITSGGVSIDSKTAKSAIEMRDNAVKELDGLKKQKQNSTN